MMWRRMAVIALVACLGVLSSGCATIVTGTRQAVTFTSDPPGATVNAGGYMTTTPGTLQLKRNRSYTVFVKKEGYQPASAFIGRTFNLWVLGNLFWEPISFTIVDLLTGAFWTLDREQVHVVLTPKQ